jgi:intracellular sulfur oxidation DsrE/DsrF family protein
MIRAMQIVFAVMLSAALAAPAMTTSALAASKTHKVAIHVNQNDPKVMNLALNNVENIFAYYKKKGQRVTVEVVTYGPGLNMFRADTSPVKDRIAAMSLAQPRLQLSACGNTHRKMSKKAGKKIPIISEAKMVPSGVIRLIELQEKGYAYVKP